MSGQIDMGWAVPPFGVEDLKAGKINIIAKGNDLEQIRDTTVRVNFANAESLKTKRALFVKFSEAYIKSLEWAYANDKAIDYFAESAEVPRAVALESRNGFYPKEAMQPYEVRGLKVSLQQAVDFKFIPKPMDEKEIAGLFDILVPKK
jgi:NitT/TauT family transport system substrate-binding protein